MSNPLLKLAVGLGKDLAVGNLEGQTLKKSSAASDTLGQTVTKVFIIGGAFSVLSILLDAVIENAFRDPNEIEDESDDNSDTV